MGMGFHDSCKGIKNDISCGKLSIFIKNNCVIFSGNTYPYKDFLKKEMRGTNFHWNAKNKVWEVGIDTLYDNDKALLRELSSVFVWDKESGTDLINPEFVQD